MAHYGLRCILGKLRIHSHALQCYIALKLICAYTAYTAYARIHTGLDPVEQATFPDAYGQILEAK